MAPSEEEDDGLPGSALDEWAARFLSALWKNSPGLVVSLIFHGALLAILPLIIFSQKIAELAGFPISIGVSAVRVDPERPYKPVAGGPPSFDGHGLDEPPVFFPDAVAAERNETKGESDRELIEGYTQGLLAHAATDPLAGGFRGRLASGPPGTNDVMGVGGGSGRGGARPGSGRGSGRVNLVARGGGSPVTEAAVELGLSWLARHQHADGAWRMALRCRAGVCKDAQPQPVDVAATSLALVAFMAGGYGPQTEVAIIDRATGRLLKYGETVRSGLRYLEAQQAKCARIATEQEGSVPVYEHAFATMALCEAYRMSRTEDLRSHAQAAVDYLVHAQNRNGGWQYVACDGNSDTSVTGACVQALRSARAAGLAIPGETLDRLAAWIRRCTRGDGSCGYDSGTGDERGATTAIGVYANHFLSPGKTTSDKLLPVSAKLIAQRVEASPRDTYLWYYAMLALFEHEGPRGASWKSVNETVTTALVKSQNREGCAAGSWDALGDALMAGYGRPLVTAMSVLTLEVYYRFADPKVRAAAATAAPR